MGANLLSIRLTHVAVAKFFLHVAVAAMSLFSKFINFTSQMYTESFTDSTEMYFLNLFAPLTQIFKLFQQSFEGDVARENSFS